MNFNKALLVILISILSAKLTFAANNFQDYCQKFLNKKTTNVTKSCQEMEIAAFDNKDDSQNFFLKKFNVEALPIDKKIKYLNFYQPKELAAFSYCYFHFRNWIDPFVFGPKKFIEVASGFSILKQELKGYEQWLWKAQGNACRRILRKELNVEVKNLNKILQDHISLIAINPTAILQTKTNTEDLLEEIQLTIRHERIHALQVACPTLDKIAITEWSKLSKEKKEVLAKKYPAYDWQNQTVAIREQLAFHYESQPLKLKELTKNCK